MRIGPDALRPAASPALIRWLALSAWRQQPGALVAALIAIAMGVALGLGIDLVNRSALAEFDDALARINGEAEYQLVGSTNRLDERVLDAVERRIDVRAASPVIELEVPVAGFRSGAGGGGLRVVGLDALRAARVTPQLLPAVDERFAGGSDSPLFADDAIFLSEAAQRRYDAPVGATLVLLVSGRETPFTVVGNLPALGGDVPIAVLDIAAAQYRLGWLGALTRIDLALVEGSAAESFVDTLELPDGNAATALRLERPDAEQHRMSNLSRAYRVNLNVLALVALLTGGFIVFATLDLAVTRLTPTLALVAVAGAPPRFGPQLVVLLALTLGSIGALCGLALGIALAWLLLGLVGGDLGGGFFASTRPSLEVPPLTLLVFFALGLGAAIAGALSPALKLRTLQPAQALKSGQALSLSARLPAGIAAPALALVGLGLLLAPPVGGLPYGAYAAIACWLFAGVLLVSPLLGFVARRLARSPRLHRSVLLWLAVERLDSANARATPALAGVVASFALVSAMAIMVWSFRVSVDAWLERVLPADLYVNIAGTGAGAPFDEADQARLASLEGVSEVRFLRGMDLTLDPARAPLELIARPVDADDPGAMLPLASAVLDADERIAGCVPVYASEPAARLYGWAPGTRLALPIGDVSAAENGSTCFQVLALWRDYARQQGALTIDLDDYERLTGDRTVGSAQVYLAEGSSDSATVTAIREAFADRTGLEVRSAGEIRRLSLTIFDRSFAVTYALEAVALLVSLFGVATTYAGEAIARLREFGMLRHLGLRRRQLVALFSAEALFCIGLGVAWGAALGVLISQVLIHRVNPQSFNWSMNTHWPLDQLLLGALAILSLGVLTACVAARRAAGEAPIAAVRSDW